MGVFLGDFEAIRTASMLRAGAERVNTYGVGELDMFEFFVFGQCPLHRIDDVITHAGRLLLHLLVTEGRLRHSVYLGLVRSQKDRRDR